MARNLIGLRVRLTEDLPSEWTGDKTIPSGTTGILFCRGWVIRGYPTKHAFQIDGRNDIDSSRWVLPSQWEKMS